jgi:hypothetical protein
MNYVLSQSKISFGRPQLPYTPRSDKKLQLFVIANICMM